jgi:hypothetical protein
MIRSNDYFLTALFISFFAFFVFSFSWAQADEKFELSSFIELWLLDNCDLGEEGLPEKTLLRFGAEAEDFLIEALEKGPDKRLISDLEESLKSKWNTRSAILSSVEGAALDKESLELVRKVTRDEYVALERDSFILRFRDRAIQGLALIGTDNSKNVLERFVLDKEFPLKKSVKDALKKIDKRLK